MSRKPIEANKSPEVASVDNPIGDIDSLQKMAILKINKEGVVDQKSLSKGVLFLNPETLEDVKSSNWSPQNVPGQSDPVLQWVSGGPRTVKFTALVTRDTSEYPKSEPSAFSSAVDMAANAVGDIASAFAGVNLPPVNNASSLLGLGGSDAKDNKLDISPNLDYYRSLTYPSYTDAGRIDTSPPLIALFTGESLSNAERGFILENEPISPEKDLWVITELKINITKQLRNLNPMEATVEFSMMQYPVSSKGADKFFSTGTSKSEDDTSFQDFPSSPGGLPL